MAVLSASDLAAVYAAFVADINAIREPIGGVTRTDLKAAIAAADAWADANAAAYNTALPQPARGALTAHQKARVLTAVIRRRYEVS